MTEHERAWPISLKNLRVTDSFWNLYVQSVPSKMIPYQWRVLNDRVEGTEKSGCIRNFRIAAGEEKGKFHGFVFQDTDLAKWLEAVAYSLSLNKNPDLEREADEVIALIARAQQPDGYLNTYFTIQEPGKEFTNLREGHELYTAGHMMEAACAYYENTGKDTFLQICIRFADLICKVFHKERYQNAVPGHQEVELGLIRLYRTTGDRKYLDMALEFINRRGTEPNYLVHEHEREDWTDVFHNSDPYFPAYGQCDEPVREQKTARGHAVRAMYMYSAMADLAWEYGDESLLEACEVLYEEIVQRQMFLTGGVGASGLYERFTTAYDLPNDRNYAESCASIGLSMFCNRMAQITHEEKYIDTMETALYNTVAAATALDGEHFFYVNPLEVWPDNCLPFTSMAHVKPVRQKWFGCACCPPNLARTYASIGTYICHTDSRHVWINLHAGIEIDAQVDGHPVHVSVRTKMPYEGETIIAIENPEKAQGAVMLRIPQYAENPVLTVRKGALQADSAAEKAGQTVQEGTTQADMAAEKAGQTSQEGRTGKPQPGSFAQIPLDGDAKTALLYFDMPARFVYANPKVRADAGKVAVKRGPLVYASEEIDNGADLAAYAIDTKRPLRLFVTPEGWTGILAEAEKLAAGEETPLYTTKKPETVRADLRLIPYCFWGNRKPGEMMVWHREVR